MGDISAHFNRSEFECQCGCGFDTVDVELIETLESVRQYFMSPVTITSGCRCPSHNKKIGGAVDSWHVIGRAADFKVQGKTPQQVVDFLTVSCKDKFGIGTYPTWVHIDSRKEKSRWKS